MKRNKPKIIIKETEVTMRPSLKKVLNRNFNAYKHINKKRKYLGSIMYDVDPTIYDDVYDTKVVKKSDGGISHFWVKQKYRDKGIGSLLLKRVERLARKDGKKRMVLEVLGWNSRAKKFYRDKGYEPIGWE